MSGAPFRLDVMTLAGLREASAVLASSFSVKELEVVQFRGELFLRAARPSSGPGFDHRLVSAVSPERGAFTRFDDEAVLAAARAAMPGVTVADAVWLDQYDAYYYDRSGARPLPVLRVRYDDPPQTWLYLDPYRGAIARKEEQLTRVNRWLYHGLHSLDFPFLYDRRPLWDIVVIALSLGGIVLSVTTMTQGWHRLRRHGRRLTRAVGRRPGV